MQHEAVYKTVTNHMKLKRLILWGQTRYTV